MVSSQLYDGSLGMIGIFLTPNSGNTSCPLKNNLAMEINKSNIIFSCSSCKRTIEPGQCYTQVPWCETKSFIDENGELFARKLDGYRIICEKCGNAFYMQDQKIEL
jgi:hypothetical protein